MKDTMTAESAVQFQGYSVGNALTVKVALEERGCSCEPYADVFTFNRWRAQGRTVRKGEHGIKLPIIVRGEKVDADTGERSGFSMRRASFVFCRCQTDKLGYAPATAVDPAAGAIREVCYIAGNAPELAPVALVVPCVECRKDIPAEEYAYGHDCEVA